MSVEPPASAKPVLGFFGSCLNVNVNLPDPADVIPSILNLVPRGFPSESLLVDTTFITRGEPTV